MTAAAAVRDTKQSSGPINAQALVPRNFPVAAAAKLWAGTMGATDAAGNAVPASALPGLKIWGRVEATADNTSGAAGAQRVDLMPGVFPYTNSGGGDAITAAHIGQLCYAVDDQTVALTDGGGTRPAAGRIEGLDGTQIKVALGETSLWDTDDDAVLTGSAVRRVRARNVLNANVANLAAYTVAANASNNDNVLGVEGDVVLLVAQTTAAQNGLYVIGVVGGGTAPLTRLGAMPTGETILAGQMQVSIATGDLFAHSDWKNTTASGVVGTNDLAFFPGRVVRECVLVAGTITVANIPILSATKTAFSINRKVANTTASTIAYATNGAPTPGAIGTASAVVFATVAAGTINVADISTLEVAVINW